MAHVQTFTRIPPRPATPGAAGAALASVGRGLATAALALQSVVLVLACGAVLFYALQPRLVVHVNTEPAYIAGTAAELAALFAAWVFASRWKKLILFLRRFGQSSANEALSSAMYRSLRDVGRLVVLDDSAFKPIAIPLRERLLVAGSTFPVLVALLAALTLGVSVVGPVVRTGEGYSLRQQGFISISPASERLADHTEYAVQPALLAFPGAIGFWLVLAGLGLLVLRAVFGAWEARRRIASETDLHRLNRRVDLLTHRLLAPKALGTVATVVSSTDALWQQVVATLADRASCIVLDVSYPTEPILWELAHCLERHPDRLLLVMNAADNYARAGRAVDEQAFAALVERTRFQGVLTYDLASAAARADFHRDLRDFVIG